MGVVLVVYNQRSAQSVAVLRLKVAVVPMCP